MQNFHNTAIFFFINQDLAIFTDPSSFEMAAYLVWGGKWAAKANLSRVVL